MPEPAAASLGILLETQTVGCHPDLLIQKCGRWGLAVCVLMALLMQLKERRLRTAALRLRAQTGCQHPLLSLSILLRPRGEERRGSLAEEKELRFSPDTTPGRVLFVL